MHVKENGLARAIANRSIVIVRVDFQLADRLLNRIDELEPILHRQHPNTHPLHFSGPPNARHYIREDFDRKSTENR